MTEFVWIHSICLLHCDFFNETIIKTLEKFSTQEMNHHAQWGGGPTPISTPNARSCLSFSETAGRSTAVPGRLQPFLEPSMPPFSTSQFRKLSPVVGGEKTSVGLVYLTVSFDFLIHLSLSQEEYSLSSATLKLSRFWTVSSASFQLVPTFSISASVESKAGPYFSHLSL